MWLWEIGNEGRRKQDEQDGGASDGQGLWEMLREWTADRRIRWLALLLAAAIGVMWMIMPRSDTFATASAAAETIENPFPVRLLYTFLVLPADVTLTDIYSDHVILSRAFLMPSALVSGALIGMMIWGVMLYYGKKRGTVLLLVLPYSLFAVFSAAVYLSIHHIGIGLLYFCFWCWVSVENLGGMVCRQEVCLSEEGAERMAKRPSAREQSADMADAVRCAVILLGALAMAVSLYWTGAACVLDIGRNYAPGRNEAAFIREHHLDRYRMMTSWTILYDEEGNVSMTDINQCNMAVNLAPYFEHNLFFNFNGGRDDRNYVTHIRLSEEETQKQYALWSREEPPEVLWMRPDLSAVYDGTVSMRDYVQVYQEDIWQVWKAGAGYYRSDIHVRRDLLEETGE